MRPVDLEAVHAWKTDPEMVRLNLLGWLWFSAAFILVWVAAFFFLWLLIIPIFACFLAAVIFWGIREHSRPRVKQPEIERLYKVEAKYQAQEARAERNAHPNAMRSWAPPAQYNRFQKREPGNDPRDRVHFE